MMMVVVMSGEESATHYFCSPLSSLFPRSPVAAAVGWVGGGLMLSDLRASLRRLRANHPFLRIKVCDDIDGDTDREAVTNENDKRQL
jgi:hypothetical protein